MKFAWESSLWLSPLRSPRTRTSDRDQRPGICETLHLCADTSALKQAIHKHLRDKKLIVLPDGLQPAYISTVEG
jgi:hypothetical protein